MSVSTGAIRADRCGFTFEGDTTFANHTAEVGGESVSDASEERATRTYVLGPQTYMLLPVDARPGLVC